MLNIRFDNGDQAELSAELLGLNRHLLKFRDMGLAKNRRREIKGCQHYKITAVGSYAVRLTFSDGHDTGIFSWDLLHDYGQRKEQLMADYQKRVGSLG